MNQLEFWRTAVAKTPTNEQIWPYIVFYFIWSENVIECHGKQIYFLLLSFLFNYLRFIFLDLP